MANPTQNQKQENKEQNRGGGGGDGGHSEPRGERSWRSVGSTVLSIGKRAAIAGAAVTSAPSVVPPALIFSAVGLAFAVPFGILFAGVACTDKIMRSLLSQPAAGPQAEEPEGEADVEGGGGEEERELILSSCYESAADELLSDGGDDKFVPTTKGLYSEENIWEQISVIRTIVGYKTSRRSSYIDEIRDLYVFTGVQPPLSFKDSSDFREIDEKLQCLKSVVGIK